MKTSVEVFIVDDMNDIQDKINFYCRQMSMEPLSVDVCCVPDIIKNKFIVSVVVQSTDG